MNARSLLWLVLCLSTSPTHGIDFPDVLKDPLQTLPDVIEKGVVLPGDNRTFVCPMQKDFSTQLLLEEAVDLALCNNPQARVAWANIKAQAGALGVARAAYLPIINGTVNHLNSYYQYPDSKIQSTSTEGFTLYGNLTWRLFDFGGRAANLDAASWMLAQALSNQDAVFQNILDAVIQAYFDAQTAKAILNARIETQTLAQSTLDSARKRELKGVSGQGDTLQATTALAKAALGQSRAEGDYRKSLSVLVYAMGVPTDTALTLPDKVDEHAGQLEQNGKDLQTWLEEAKRHHPAIVAAQAQWEAAKNRITAARSEGLPTLDFVMNAYQNGYPGQGVSLSQTRVETIGVNLTVPLFEGFSRTYQIRGAEAQAEQREAELADTEHQILMEVVKAYADATSSLRNLEFSSTLLKAAQDALITSQRRYDKGAADILEILNTQTALADAQQERIRTLAEWRAARLRILICSGLLGEELIRNMEDVRL